MTDRKGWTQEAREANRRYQRDYLRAHPDKARTWRSNARLKRQEAKTK